MNDIALSGSVGYSEGLQIGLSGGVALVLAPFAEKATDLIGTTWDVHVRLLWVDVTVSVPYENGCKDWDNPVFSISGGAGYGVGVSTGTTKTHVR